MSLGAAQYIRKRFNSVSNTKKPRGYRSPTKREMNASLAEAVQNTVEPNPDRSTFIDLPFAPPPDTVLDIPVPPSVNRTRKIDYANQGIVDDWKASCDAALMASGQYRFAKRNPVGERFEVRIILCEKQCRQDLDNAAKSAIDYLRRIELIADDGPKHLRRVTLEWGEAPRGCRIVLRGMA